MHFFGGNIINLPPGNQTATWFHTVQHRFINTLSWGLVNSFEPQLDGRKLVQTTLQMSSGKIFKTTARSKKDYDATHRFTHLPISKSPPKQQAAASWILMPASHFYFHIIFHNGDKENHEMLKNIHHIYVEMTFLHSQSEKLIFCAFHFGQKLLPSPQKTEVPGPAFDAAQHGITDHSLRHSPRRLFLWAPSSKMHIPRHMIGNILG